MKADKSMRYLPRTALYGLVCVAMSCTSKAMAAETNVNIMCDALCSPDAGFFPPVVTINVNDKVVWTWADQNLHSTTSFANMPRLWDSGLVSAPFSFTNTFASAGNFPYFCSNHGFTGAVMVAAANLPPSVAITAPTNGATFAAPWTGTIQANTSDTDDTVSKVDFFAGTTLLGTVSNPPPSFGLGVTIPSAGTYILKGVATDSRGATNTSAGVAVNIITPQAITLSSPQKPSATSFQFSYTADPGLNYIIKRAGNLATWLPLATNTAVSNPMPFTDNSATGSLDFYRVQLVPNP
jgi:plastocyanin